MDPEFSCVFNTTTSPATTTHALTEFRMAGAFVRGAIEAERQGFDAIAITHFQDAGLADVFDKEVDNPVMRGPLNMAQITLACTLGLEARNPEFLWRPQRPRLGEWFAPIAARPSFVATVPK